MELQVLSTEMRAICWCYLEIINTKRTAEGPAKTLKLPYATATFAHKCHIWMESRDQELETSRSTSRPRRPPCSLYLLSFACA